MAGFLVSASTGAMSSLLQKLGTMLSDEYKLLKDVRGDIKFLRDELETMQAFLLVMADVEEPDHQAKLRARAVRELSYDIEDKIDKFMVLVDDEPSSNSDRFRELFSKSMKKLANIKTRHNIAKDVKDIKSQVKEISKRFARYEIKESSKSQNAKVDPRIVAVYKDAAELVGIDGPRDELVNWLSNKEGKSANQLKVVSIVGYGGLGKTTLAKQVYEKLGANFECRAFVSISRNPDMTKILSSIFSQIQNKQETHAGSVDSELIIGWIRNFLKDKRYFIIIDDVWGIQTWQALDCALVKNGCGSVIMTTTRINDVAKSCCSSPADFVYKIQPLGAADSKKLFFKRLFGCEENCPPNLKEVSEYILKKCGGLPLAINAISGLLATGKTKEEWGRVRSSIGFAQGKNHEIEAMNYILSLSYIDLPLYLRSCLLYLTLFPEDHDIGRRRLVHRWISEGFIHGEDGQDLVELGETYFHELVNRSLIQPIDIGCDGKATRCRVHDTILDFLLYKSTEENFCTMLSNHSKPDSRVRRLSLMGNEDQGSVEQLDLSHARSLGAFGHTQEYLPSLIAKSNALRVLDLQDCGPLRNHHVKDIGRLFQLRYLNICRSNISELPGQIGDLKYLETLDAYGLELVELPKSVTRLKRLARLFVPLRIKFPDGIGEMENLQELGYHITIFKQSLNFLKELGKLTNLRKLSINWDSCAESDEECYKEKGLSIVSSLCKLDTCKLRDLSIIFELTEKDATLIAHPFFPALNSIRCIDLWKGQFCWISKWMLSLVNLEIFSTDVGMEQQGVEMVGSIPTLLQFWLVSRCVGPIIISGGFQQLQLLCINRTELMFEEGAMPNLKNLYANINLSKFKSGCIDDLGIQHLSSLASLHVSIINCRDVTIEEVEGIEGGLKSMVDAHPNRPTQNREMVLIWASHVLFLSHGGRASHGRREREREGEKASRAAAAANGVPRQAELRRVEGNACFRKSQSLLPPIPIWNHSEPPLRLTPRVSSSFSG